jgi:hypothetical protein
VISLITCCLVDVVAVMGEFWFHTFMCRYLWRSKLFVQWSWLWYSFGLYLPVWSDGCFFLVLRLTLVYFLLVCICCFSVWCGVSRLLSFCVFRCLCRVLLRLCCIILCKWMNFHYSLMEGTQLHYTWCERTGTENSNLFE